MANIGDLFFGLHGDSTPLVKDAADAGTAAGGSFQKTFGVSLKTALGGIVGGALGTGFALAIKGAGELDTAEHNLAAATGLTGQAAKDADDALANMYRNNLQGFDDIEAAMANVHNDLHLTGQEANTTTQAFLNLANATGTDAADQVASFQGILDAWNLTADHSQNIMDQLIVSNQKYGGSLSDNEAALQTLAPALQALGLNLNDGVGLLNLFTSAGLDSSKATQGLNIAVKSLKPGQTLNDLITQISSIQDPTLRAQAAIQVFGARAGVGLANVLKPGITGLSDFEISASDAAGATDKASNAVTSSFGNQFTLLLKNAGGALAQFGSNFGPLLLVANAFGPKFATAIAGGLGSIAGVIGPKILSALGISLPTAAAAGTAEGVAMGGAAAAAEVTTETAGVVAGQAEVAAAGTAAAGTAGGVLGTAMGAAAALAVPAAILAGAAGIALAFKALVLDPGLQQQSRDIGTSVGNEIVAGNLTALEKSRDALQTGIAQINAEPLGGFLYGDQIKDLQGQLDKVNAAIEGSVAASTTEVKDKFGELVPFAKSTGTLIPAAIAGAITAGDPAVKAAGAQTVEQFAQGIADARSKPQDAYSAMLAGLKKPETTAQEEAKLAGELTSKDLAAGLKSGDPEVKAQAQIAKQAIIDRLTELGASSNGLGKSAMNELNAGIKSKDPEIRAAALAAKNTALAQLNALKAPATTAGSNAGTAFASALAAKAAAEIKALLALRNFETDSKSTTAHHAVGGRWPAGQASWVGEQGPEINVQARDGYVLNHADAMQVARDAMAGPGQGGGVQFNFTLPAGKSGPTVGDIQRAVIQLAHTGYLPRPVRALG